MKQVGFCVTNRVRSKRYRSSIERANLFCIKIKLTLATLKRPSHFFDNKHPVSKN